MYATLSTCARSCLNCLDLHAGRPGKVVQPVRSLQISACTATAADRSDPRLNVIIALHHIKLRQVWPS